MIQALLKKYSSGKIVLLFFVVTQAVYAFMLLVTIPQVMEYSNGMRLFDLQPMGYSAEYARNLLDTLGQEGRAAYLFRQIPIDMIYPFLFAIAYSLLLALVFKKGFSPESGMHALCLVPIAAGLFDYLENIGIIAMLSIYPGFSDSLARLTNLFSVSKSIFTTLFFILLFVGIAVLIKKRLGNTETRKGKIG